MDQIELEFEASERDIALRRLADSRGDLIEAAFLVALSIAQAKGSVTSPEVLDVMKKSKHGTTVQNVDRRFMGPVFRRKGWRRTGWSPEGSHCRPVSVWTWIGA